MIERKVSLKLMGSAFELIVVHEAETMAENLLTDGIEEIKRIEQLLTEFSETSITAHINRNAGIAPVNVPDEVFRLLHRCKHLSEITQGAFDITVSPLKKLYSFKKEDFTFPSGHKIREALQIVGFRHLHLLPNNKVYLAKKGMRISFAAIGKGYAADCVRKIWNGKAHGGVINASGDLCVFGKRADGTDWNVAIANPENRNDLLFSIPMPAGAVATSGDAEQFFIKEGIRYSHNIHPKTGMPLQGIRSVSVFHSSAELCDALATAVYVMGAEAGLHFINQLPGAHAIMVDENNNVFFSKQIQMEHAA